MRKIRSFLAAIMVVTVACNTLYISAANTGNITNRTETEEITTEKPVEVVEKTTDGDDDYIDTDMSNIADDILDEYEEKGIYLARTVIEYANNNGVINITEEGAYVNKDIIITAYVIEIKDENAVSDISSVSKIALVSGDKQSDGNNDNEELPTESEDIVWAEAKANFVKSDVSKAVYYAQFKVKCPANDIQSYAVAVSDDEQRIMKSPIKLKFYVDENKVQSTDTIIFDAEAPRVTNAKLTYNNTDKMIEISAQISDIGTGIKEIWYGTSEAQLFKYGQNHKKDYFENGEKKEDENSDFEIIHTKGEIIQFDVWKDYLIDDPIIYDFYIKVKDNMNNEMTISTYDNGIMMIGGKDTKAPIIDNIKITHNRQPANVNGNAEETTTQEAPFEISTDKTAMYFNERFKIIIYAKDEAEDNNHISGIGEVCLMDGKDKKVTSTNTIVKTENGWNVYEIYCQANFGVDDFIISVTDNGGVACTKEISEYKYKEENKTTKSYKQSAYYETESPAIYVDYSGASNYENKSANEPYWYNIESENLKIVAEEETAKYTPSGLRSTSISEIKNTTNANGEIETTLEPVSHMEEPTDKTILHEFAIDTKELTDGMHNYIVYAEDRCGNKSQKEFSIGVDHTIPTVTYEMVSPNKKEIDGEVWFDIEDTIIMKAHLESQISEVDEVELTVNGIPYAFNLVKSAEGEIEEPLKKCIEFEIPADKCDKKYQTIEIVCKCTTESGNTSEETKYLCHIDKEIPKVEYIYATKENTNIIGKIINFINTGTFSNDTVNIYARVSDPKFDSGVGKVTIKYNKGGETITEDMATYISNNENESYFIYQIINDGTVFDSDIEIVVYDKLEKYSLEIPVIVGKLEELGKTGNDHLMIEMVKPLISIDLPKSDGVDRTDNKIWYRANKEIKVVVEDVNSGIREVDMDINGVDITKDITSKNILKAESTSKADKNILTEEYNFTTDYLEGVAGESKEGKYLLSIKVVDNAGNISTSNAEFNIDRKNPVITQFTFTPLSEDDIESTNKFLDKLEYGFYFKKEFTAKVVVNDDAPTSGLNKITYELVPYENGKQGEKTVDEVAIVNNVAIIKIPSEFKGQIVAKVYDNVGNVSKEKTPEAFVADKTSPDIVISDLKESENKDGNKNKLYKKNVKISVAVSDYKSGLRKVSYSIDAEVGKVDETQTQIDNLGLKVGDKLENGWVVSEMDNNLVTKVVKTFKFVTDDNDVRVNIQATDRSNNKSEWMKSETFSLDKTLPQITIDFPEGVKDNPTYYNSNKKAVITATVIERNFEEKLIETMIENTFKGNVPKVQFVSDKEDNKKHVATMVFPEGDFEFSLSGKDRAGHQAEVIFGKEKNTSYSTSFIVDETAPVIQTNFKSFTNKNSEGKTYFNKNRIAEVTVTEHNFDSELMNLVVEEKKSGTNHDESGFEETYYSIFSDEGWSSSENSDVHSIKLNIKKDGVYKISIKPTDCSENKGNSDMTEIFEIDCTSPVISSRNGEEVKADNTEFVDAYDMSKEEVNNPTIGFDDINYDYLEYSITKYIPEYSSEKELDRVVPNQESDKQTSKKFVLKDFEKDGAYFVEIKAYDKAGNVSKLNKSTYLKTMDTDVLAYIENSHPGNGTEQGTGWYSFENQNGPLSKRPDSFSDLHIVVFAKTDTTSHIVLKDNDGNETDTGLTAENEENKYGVGLYRYTLKGDYFKNNYQEDTDATFYLTVNNSDKRVELGQIHIDNIAPTCTIPEQFHDWGWVAGSNPEPMKFTGISEKLDVEKTAVYVDGKEAYFDYDEENDVLSVSLEKGEHNVGLSLTDKAGNIYNIAEVSHLGVGNFRLYSGIAGGFALISGVGAAIFFRKRKKVA